jgi:hypothetical protein
LYDFTDPEKDLTRRANQRHYSIITAQKLPWTAARRALRRETDN